MEVRSKRKVKEAVVVSNKMEKTVVVETQLRFRHPVYQKVVNKTSRFKAHDEEKKCKVGDKVLIMECRPLSKDKRWRVVKVL